MKTANLKVTLKPWYYDSASSPSGSYEVKSRQILILLKNDLKSQGVAGYFVGCITNPGSYLEF